MRLPGAERAVVDVAKLHNYALAPYHEEGKHKARVFAAALGLERQDAAWLRDRLIEAAGTHDAAVGRRSAFGRRYTIDFPLTRAGRSAMVRSCWIVRTGEDFPRLTTCYVL